MSTLSTPAEAINLRDNLRDWLEVAISQDSRFVISHDLDHVYSDFADELIRDGWVTRAPEVEQ